MRLRGLVFERFVTFDRAEVNLCDDSGVPLDVILFVGPSGAGKSALLRGMAGLLAEALGGSGELGERDIRRTAAAGRCRGVFDDDAGGRADGLSEAGGSRVIVTLEKELTKASTNASVRGTPVDAFDRWRRSTERDEAPRAAFSMATGSSGAGAEVEANEPPSEDERDPLVAWLFDLRGGPHWDFAVRALDRVLWPYRFNHVTSEGDAVFSSGAGLASSDELGDAFASVLVMVLELLRLTTARPDDELVYVVDDIDAHLHPRWQSRILGDLRRAFPRVQLVATTHSPFVVASVAPYQVFRLEPPEAGIGSSICRVSDRIQKGATVSQVMDLAFGTPELPGPRWAQTPPLSVRSEVLAILDDDLTRGAVVYVLPEPIHVRDVRDAFGEVVLASADSSLGHLFFIDHEPGAAWGHPCEYVFRARDGKLARSRAIWPPANLDRFVAVGRG